MPKGVYVRQKGVHGVYKRRPREIAMLRRNAKKAGIAAAHKRWGPNFKHWGHVQRRYGLSPEQYAAILQQQGGVCAICKSPPILRALSVDHNHTTGVIRGLLCHRCNVWLAAVEDSVFVEKAKGYLGKCV